MRMSSGGIGSPVMMSRLDWRWNWVPAAGLALPVVSSGPKYSLNWTCVSSVMCWSRNSRTECSSKAARIGPNSRGLKGRVMSMPSTSAPNSGWSRVTLSGPLLRMTASGSVDDRLVRQHAQLAADRVGRGRHELGQHHHRHVLRRIAPERRRGGAAPGIFAARADDVRPRGIEGDREAQPEADAFRRGFRPARHAHGGHVTVQVVHGHELDRLAAEQAHAVELALVEHELAEAEVVRRGRDQAAAARVDRARLEVAALGRIVDHLELAAPIRR